MTRYWLVAITFGYYALKPALLRQFAQHAAGLRSWTGRFLAWEALAQLPPRKAMRVVDGTKDAKEHV